MRLQDGFVEPRGPLDPIPLVHSASLFTQLLQHRLLLINTPQNREVSKPDGDPEKLCALSDSHNKRKTDLMSNP